MVRDRFHVTDELLGHLSRVSHDLSRRVEQGTLQADWLIEKLSTLARTKVPEPCLFEAMRLVKEISSSDVAYPECIVAIVRVLAEAGEFGEARAYTGEMTKGDTTSLRGVAFATIFGISGDGDDLDVVRDELDSEESDRRDAIHLALLQAAMQLRWKDKDLLDLMHLISGGRLAKKARSAMVQYLAIVGEDHGILRDLVCEITGVSSKSSAYAAIFWATKDPKDLAEAKRCAQEILSNGFPLEYAKAMMAIYRYTCNAQDVVAARKVISEHVLSLQEQFALVAVQTFSELGQYNSALTHANHLSEDFPFVEALALLYEHFGQKEHWKKARRLVEALKTTRTSRDAFVACTNAYIALARAQVRWAKKEAATVA